jgi:beta-phosphoglucomutase-like phosphatase (HAD superfamily)
MDVIAHRGASGHAPEPTSKPDPAIYRLAGERLGVAGAQAVAIEDAVAGVRSAVGAGFPTVGNVLFVAEDERARSFST